MGVHWKQEELETLKYLHGKGMSEAEIGAFLGRNGNAVHIKLLRTGAIPAKRRAPVAPTADVGAFAPIVNKLDEILAVQRETLGLFKALKEKK